MFLSFPAKSYLTFTLHASLSQCESVFTGGGSSCSPPITAKTYVVYNRGRRLLLLALLLCRRGLFLRRGFLRSSFLGCGLCRGLRGCLCRSSLLHRCWRSCHNFLFGWRCGLLGGRCRRLALSHRRSCYRFSCGFHWHGRGCAGQCIFRLASTLLGRLISGRSRCGFLLRASATRRWRRWRRFRWRIWLQKLYDFRGRTQLAVQQQQEGFIRYLLVLWMLRCNAHLRHFREREFLPDRRPFGQEILDLLFDSRSPRRDGIEQQRVRPVGHQELPCLRWQGKFARHQLLGKILGIVFKTFPALDKTFVDDLLLHRRNIFIA